jgi:hypothetical protein
MIFVFKFQSFTSFYIENLQLKGSSFLVNLTAFTEYTHEMDYIIEYLDENKLIRRSNSRAIDILFYTLVAFMIALLIALFKIWKGRIDSIISTLAQKRLENMDLDTVKILSTGTVLDSIAELTKDENMEVEKENITLLELLGEGAFGLVKKATMIKNGEKVHVAVKMLKSK